MSGSGLLGPNGKPISSKDFKNKKAAAPALGEKYGRWSGPDSQYFTMPGGGVMQFDLSQLTLDDYRQMLDHYQINSSLTVLTFLLHQMEWHVEGGTAKQNDFYNEQLRNNWTRLVRAKATAFWAGFSPNVLQWENDTPSRRITLTKIKDLVPEECEVNWKKIDPGKGKQKLSVYDGIRQFGQSDPIPVANTYWYPLLMENGNYYGKKLLRSAFQPWFFSQLIHLFANRYYERYGEPTAVGRAPYDDDVRYGGTTMKGNKAMEMILQNLRNRSVVVLPTDKTQFGDETTLDHDYQIEYLESQMRGADFERYLTRLDEEMSLALFTPILLMRTADVGSYNLGTQHSIIYQWMLNAISGDWSYYDDWYLLRPLRDLNFGTNAEMPRIKYHQMGRQNLEVVNNLVNALVTQDKVKLDYDQLGDIAGLTLKEIKTLTADDPDAPGGGGGGTGQQGGGAGASDKANRSGVYGVADSLSERIERQVINAYRRDEIKDWSRSQFSLGFKRQMEDAFINELGAADALGLTRVFYDFMQNSLDALVEYNPTTPEEFMAKLRPSMDRKLDAILGDKS